MYPPHFPVRLFPMSVSLFVFCKRVHLCHFLDSMCGSDGKESTCSAGDLGSIPGLGRSPGEGKGYPLQDSGQENPMDREPWWATVHKLAKTQTQRKWLSVQAHIFSIVSVQFSSVTQSCPTLCDPMNRSTPGLPVHHQLLEFTQTHVHRVSDAIQPSHPLSSPSPPAPNPS